MRRNVLQNPLALSSGEQCETFGRDLNIRWTRSGS
jgi:hypothetical protein